MNYAQLFQHYFTYQKTRIFTDNKKLSGQLEEQANQLRDQLNALSSTQHSLNQVINIVKDTISTVRDFRDSHVKSVNKRHDFTHRTLVGCACCGNILSCKHYQVTPTFFSYKPANFERKTAYAMYRISVEDMSFNLFSAIKHAFKMLCYTLGLWTPKKVEGNEPINDFLQWMNNLAIKQEEGPSSDYSDLAQCYSLTCRPRTSYYSGYHSYSYSNASVHSHSSSNVHSHS